jgi:hypothetical protein
VGTRSVLEPARASDLIAPDARTVSQLIAAAKRDGFLGRSSSVATLSYAIDKAVVARDALGLRAIADAADYLVSSGPEFVNRTSAFAAANERATREAQRLEAADARTETVSQPQDAVGSTNGNGASKPTRHSKYPGRGDQPADVPTGDAEVGIAPLPSPQIYADALKIVAERYARGEINREEFLQIRDDFRPGGDA